MDIVFRDFGTQRLFNEHAELEARYGAVLALRAASRLAVLAAARDLSVLPSAPPIGFRALGGGGEGYVVRLDATHRLRFVGSGASGRGEDRLAGVRCVEVLGIETVDASGDRDRRR